MLTALLVALALISPTAHTDSSVTLRGAQSSGWDGRCATPGPKVVAAYAAYGRARERYMRGEIRPILQSATNIMEREGPHTIRWACTRRGLPRVRLVRLHRSGNGAEFDVVASMRAAGYDSPSRIYLVFTPGYTRWCGTADLGPSDEALYAMVECWSAATTLHELLHTFGAVPDEAPHEVADNHCSEWRDIMCRDHGTRRVCPRKPWSHIDCGRDDYYMHEGNWWDVEDSPFLEREE